MRFLYILIFIALIHSPSAAQLVVPVKMDTSQTRIKRLYLFINDYMKQDTISNCFFLQDGIASLYGGMDKGKTSYEEGLKALRLCYQAGKCDFDKLYLREVGQQYSSSLTYTFAAVFCKYLIDNYGMDYFYEVYYDKKINSDNFLETLIRKTGKSKEEIKKEIEKLIGLPS